MGKKTDLDLAFFPDLLCSTYFYTARFLAESSKPDNASSFKELS